MAFAPRFSQQDAAILKSLRTFGLGVTSLRVQLRRPDQDEIAVEKTVIVQDGQTEVAVELDVTITGSEELFLATLEIHSGEVLIFSGTVNVIARTGANPTVTNPVLDAIWVGPGANATRIVISPRDKSLAAVNGRLTLTAAAFDANDAPVTDPDFVSRWQWRVTDPTLGSIPANGGEFVAAGVAGVALVTVTTPNLLRDTVRLTLISALPAARVRFARQVEVLDRGTTANSVPVTVTDPNNTPVTNATLSYLSRNTEVATVSSSGAITGVTRGQAIVLVRAQQPGSTSIVEDSLLAVVAEPGGPVVISSVDRFQYLRNELITVSVFVDMRTSPQKLGSTAIDVTWNPAQLSFQNSANGASGVTATVNSTLVSTGLLTLAMADASSPGLSGRIELLRITYRTSSTATLGNLTLTAKELSAASFADLLGLTVQVSHALSVP